MIEARALRTYLREQSLPLALTEVQVAAMTLSAVLEVPKPRASPDVFRYPVPRLGEGGARVRWSTSWTMRPTICRSGLAARMTRRWPR